MVAMDYGLITSEKELAIKALKGLTIGIVCGNACKGTGYLFDGHSYTDCKCVEQFVWKVRLIGANIPKDAWKWSLADIPKDWCKKQKQPMTIVTNYVQMLEGVVEKGQGLFLQGTPGVGKTIIGSLILMEALKKGYLCWYTQLATLRSLIMESVTDADKRENLQWVKDVPQFIFLDEIDKINRAKDMDSYGSLYLSEFFTDFCGRGGCLIVASNTAICSIQEGKKKVDGLEEFYLPNIIDRLMALKEAAFTGKSFRIVDDEFSKLLDTEIRKVK
jgi:hypothetical protein